MDFHGKKVLVTGAASGIGKEVAAEYVRRGATVIAFDIQEIPDAEKEGMFAYKVDLRDADELVGYINRVFETHGDLDIIINNAGVSEFKNLVDLETWEFDAILNANLRAMFIIAREFARYRQNNKDKWGSIVNIASTRALMSEPGSEAYAASKGGILALTHALAASLADYQITVNAISPGWIETGDYSVLTKEDHLQHFSARVGKPEDIARACLFLTEEKNNFINGQNIVIDGGMTKKMIYV